MTEFSLEDQYAELLRKHVSTPEEKYLLAVADLGQRMVVENVPVEEVASIHQEALNRLAKESPDLPIDAAAPVIADPLMELLMAYGLATRERIEARERTMKALHQKEMELLQAQKMESIGRLAGGVAHDFNNVLMAIGLHSELVLRELSRDNPIRAEVEEIKKNGNRAAALTRQLLAFGRKQLLEPKVLDLNSVLSDMDKMLRRVIGEDINLVTSPARGLWNTKADPSQIEQVLVNLVVNARDAMPRGGKLTMETQNVHLDENYARKHEAVDAGPYVMLAVSDNGEGMDQATLAKIFEPFFTTKEKNKGSGLGLSTVYGIVKQSGGHIWVYSEPTNGTTFKIYLRRCEEAAQVAEEKKTAVEVQKGSETILLVEDELSIRRVVSMILKQNGYTVLEAKSGTEALKVFDKHRGAVDLLLTDVVMPEMSGRELADQITKSFPGMKIIFMSGYAQNAIVHQGILEPGTVSLQKPVTVDDLLEAVKTVLDA